MRLIVGFVCGL